jgi:hypothetical protein
VDRRHLITLLARQLAAEAADRATAEGPTDVDRQRAWGLAEHLARVDVGEVTELAPIFAAALYRLARRIPAAVVQDDYEPYLLHFADSFPAGIELVDRVFPYPF